MKFKLVDNQKRDKLAEGRNYGQSMAFCRKDGDIFTTMMPITACGDFLGDYVYSQVTGKPYSIYGLNTQKDDSFDYKKDEAYLVFGILKQGRGENDYANYKRDYEILAQNYSNLQKFINWFEKKFKINKKTHIFKIQENRYIAIISLFWAQSSYRISLFKLLMRTGMFYKEGNPYQFLTKDWNFDDQDIYMINSAKPKIDRMLDGFIPEQDMQSCHNPHECGVVNFKFPEKIVKPLILKPQPIENIW